MSTIQTSVDRSSVVGDSSSIVPLGPIEETGEERLALATGGSVAVEDGNRVVVRSPAGAVQLEVRVTPEGPVLRFEASSIEVAAAETFRVSCGEFEVETRGDFVTRVGGDVTQEVVGSVRVGVQGAQDVEADSVRVRSRRGDVELEANDDVKVRGERIKLNC